MEELQPSDRVIVKDASEGQGPRLFVHANILSPKRKWGIHLLFPNNEKVEEKDSQSWLLRQIAFSPFPFQEAILFWLSDPDGKEEK